MAETWLGRDYGDYSRQHSEWLELTGLLEESAEPEWTPDPGAVRFREPVTNYPLDERTR